MSRNGFCITVVSSPGSFLSAFAANEGARFEQVSMERRITPLRDLLTCARLVRLFRRLKPKIVHAHTPKAGLLSMLAASVAGIPVRIYHMRGLPSTTASGIQKAVLTAAELVACRLSHLVICVSNSVRDVALQRKLVHAEKIVVLAHGSGNGVDAVGRFNPDALPQQTRARERAKLGIQETDVVVGYVGRLVRDKGILELAEAWKLVREKVPNAHLMLVGPFEERDPIPHETRNDLARDARVHLLGMVWETPPLYAAMDLFVLPTYREGFPNGVLEASAMKLPVIATNVPGCVDAVIPGETGTLVPAGEAKPLASAIIDYIGHADRRRTEGEAGRRRVLAWYRPEIIWGALLDQYTRLISDRGVTE